MECSYSHGDILYYSHFKEGTKKIFVTTLSIGRVAFYVNLNIQVEDLKKEIQVMEGIPFKKTKINFSRNST